VGPIEERLVTCNSVKSFVEVIRSRHVWSFEQRKDSISAQFPEKNPFHLVDRIPIDTRDPLGLLATARPYCLTAILSSPTFRFVTYIHNDRHHR
jgi:hypothetical protein